MEFIFEHFNLILGGGLIILLFWTGYLQYSLFRIKRRQKKLLGGKEGGDLEEILLESLKKLQIAEGEIEKIKKNLNHLILKSQKDIQKVGLVRFNPFPEAGGDLSFAVALLDEKGNGVVISSLHGRDQTRVYSKPIEEGKSKYNLSVEEEEAIKKALRG